MTTAAEWKRALAATHPDHGGNLAAFVVLSAARKAWQATQETGCACGCGRPFILRKARRGKPAQRFYSKHCAARVNGLRRRKLRLKGQTAHGRDYQSASN